MKYYLILGALFITTLGACSVSQKAVKGSENLRQEAQDFSLSIVKLYFSDDCDTFFNSMSDSVLVMDGDGVFPKFGKKDKLCRSFKSAIEDKEKTFQDYLDSYTVDILTQSELEKRFKHKLPDYYKTIDSDFFFIGHKLKADKKPSEDFIWDDMFVFMEGKSRGNG